MSAGGALCCSAGFRKIRHRRYRFNVRSRPWFRVFTAEVMGNRRYRGTVWSSAQRSASGTGRAWYRDYRKIHKRTSDSPKIIQAESIEKTGEKFSMSSLKRIAGKPDMRRKRVRKTVGRKKRPGRIWKSSWKNWKRAESGGMWSSLSGSERIFIRKLCSVCLSAGRRNFQDSVVRRRTSGCYRFLQQG